MKKVVIYLVALFLLSSGAFAQITQLQSNLNGGFYVLFHQAGIKLLGGNGGDTVHLYNLNNTPFDTIVIPTVTPPEMNGPGTGYMAYLSEDLFDTDPNTIEYLYDYNDASNVRHVRIIRQDGTILFSADSTGIMGATFPDITLHSIVNTDSGTFMFLYGNSGTSLYKLPGTLFCPACDGSNVPAYFITGIHNPSGNGNNMELKAFPNPSNNKTKIYYTLPEGVTDADLILYDLLSQEKKRIKVNRYSPFIEVSTSDIAAGNYFYRIETSKGISQGKTQVVVH